MKCLGQYVPPAVAALPPTGVAGQEVVYGGRIFIWNVTKNSWEPEYGHRTLRIADPITDSAAAYKLAFTIPVEANTLYEIDSLLIHMCATSSANIRIKVSGPNGLWPSLYCLFQRASSGAGAVSNGTINNPSAVTAGNVLAGSENKQLRSRMTGVILSQDAGNVLVEISSSLNGNLVTLVPGSFLSYRRVT